jgi:hypothetical protein
VTRDLGYRYPEALARRVLGEILMVDAPEPAAAHLAAAESVLHSGGARDALARVWVAQAEARRAAGDAPGARLRLEQALAVFEDLGTLDEPARVRAMLETLPAGEPREGVRGVGGEGG